MFKRFAKAVFPNAIPQFHPPSSSVSPAIISNANKSSSHASTILLLGWGGSNRKNLTKIIDFYTGEGVGVVSMTMPLLIPKLLRHYFENLTIAEVQAQIDKSAPNHRLHIHSFSNNGLWTYGSMSKRGILPSSLGKLIIDSAPFFKYQDIPVKEEAMLLSKVFVPILLKTNSYNHPILTPVLTSFFFGLFSFTRFVLANQRSLPLVEDFIGLL